MACSVTQVWPPWPRTSLTWGILGNSSSRASLWQTAWVTFTGPQESKLLHSCSPAAREPATGERIRTDRPSPWARVARKGICPARAPTRGMATRGAPPMVRSSRDNNSSRSRKGSGASMSSFGWSRVDSSNLGHSPPLRVVRCLRPTRTTVRWMGHTVRHPLSWQVKVELDLIRALRKGPNSRASDAASSADPSCSMALNPTPQAPMAPGLGGTIISRPEMAARVQAKEGFWAGLPWKNTRRARVRCPITLCR